MDPKIHLTIKSREKTIFDEDTYGVSSINDVGPFDVLPMHENFISLIREKIIIHDKKTDREMKIESGLLRANDNKVSIFLGI